MKPLIVGVCLVKNEQHFVAWALMNALNFCDKILVWDNMSEDRTYEIVSAIADEHDHVEVVRVKDGNNTHRYIEEYAGKPVWIIRIDGDEVFNPTGLSNFKSRLYAGEFDHYWMIHASTLHVVGIQFDSAIAYGYTQPATEGCLSMYNFNAIKSWKAGRRERLLGLGKIVFQKGYSIDHTFPYWKYHNWSESEFKGLHLCFMPRSPLDPQSESEEELGSRFNIAEIRLARRIARAVNWKYSKRPDYKTRTYAKGEVTKLDISGFGSPLDFRKYDPDYQSVLDTIKNVTQSRQKWSKHEVS